MKLSTPTLINLVVAVVFLIFLAAFMAGCAHHRPPAPLAVVPCNRSVREFSPTAYARIEDAPPGCWEILERDSTVRRVVKP